MKERQSFSNIDIVITGNVAWQDTLSWDVKIMYGVIRGLTRNDYYCCYASNEYLGELMNKSERTIRTFLNELEAVQAIVRDYAYVECSNDGKIRRFRAVVPTDIYNKFLLKREEMIDAKNMASQKISSKGGEKLPLVGGEKLPPTNKEIYPYKNIISNIKEGINPLTPLQGGEEAATLIEPEQIKVFGEFGNVRLTESQKEAFKGEFGSELALALIEQLSAYLKSGVKRYRKKADHYAILRDWALRRNEPKAAKKVLLGGRDMQRRTYSEDELIDLFTKLDENDTDSA